MGNLLAARVGILLAILFAGAPAFADDLDLISPQAFEGLIDLRAVGVDGQPSYLDGGFGRTRYGGTDAGAFKGQLSLADAALVWKPQFTWALGAIVDVEHQDGQQHAFDLVQAYLTFRPTFPGDTRFTARAGLYYPPISEEHEGPTWAVANTITPSAINSWIGEEVKVVGGEARLARRIGGGEVSATVGLFGYDDTAGTLLAFRGWGLTDFKATAFGQISLPPLDPYMAARQPPYTDSTADVDGRVGYYGRLDWNPPGRFAVNAVFYDNRGDKTGLDSDWQWAWDTRFWDFGASFDVDDNTRILAQGVVGHSLMGYPDYDDPEWINLGFASAYVLATHSFGRSGVAGRAEYFETSDRNFDPGDDPDDNRGEHGWALTGDYRYDLTPHARLMVEVLHVQSRRPILEGAGLDPFQSQTQVQTSMRLSF